MKSGVASLAVALTLSTSAFAATVKPMSVDHSGSFLIDSATSEKLFQEYTPAKVVKLYPQRKFRFVSEVTGGFSDTRTCIVSARAMLLPVVMLPVQGYKVVYSPIKSAVAFDAAPNLDRAQCQELARNKLKEAIQSMASALASS